MKPVRKIPPKCKTCRFFSGSKTEPRLDHNDLCVGFGICRRHAPTPQPCSDDRELCSFPFVMDEDWCGEWQGKEAASDEWPTWEELMARQELGAGSKGMRVRVLNLCGRMMRDGVSVEQAIGERKALMFKDGGQKGFNLLCCALAGWRSDGGGK